MPGPKSTLRSAGAISKASQTGARELAPSYVRTMSDCNKGKEFLIRERLWIVCRGAHMSRYCHRWEDDRSVLSQNVSSTWALLAGGSQSLRDNGCVPDLSNQNDMNDMFAVPLSNMRLSCSIRMYDHRRWVDSATTRQCRQIFVSNRGAWFR